MAGGGTGGSVTPLLAVADEIRGRASDVRFFFLGTKNGPEKKLLRSTEIEFGSITAGKLRRYLSWKNIVDIFLIIIGFFQALRRLRKIKPQIIVSAGGYVSVPIVWAGWFLRIPSVIHQQDLAPGLANRLMQSMSAKITVAFEDSLKNFPLGKTIWTGNPVRKNLDKGDANEARRLFNLTDKLPTVLVFGGGTGAQKINELAIGAINELTKQCQVLHLFGQRKVMYKINDPRYHGYEFLTDEMKEAYAVADLVVCRAGLGTLSEIAALGKAAIVIPISNSHQEINAALFKKANAAVVLNQEAINSEFLVRVITDLLANHARRRVLKNNISRLAKPDAAARLADIVISSAKK